MKIPIKYRKGYKNQLYDTVSFQLPTELWPDELIETQFFRLDAGGRATIRSGYSWDGASGPTADVPAKQIVVPTLVHDMLCQLDRAGLMRRNSGGIMKALLIVLFLLSGCTTYSVHKVSPDGVETTVKIASTRSFEQPDMHYERVGNDASLEFSAASVDNNTEAFMGMFSQMMGMMMQLMKANMAVQPQ
jgi:hypothetical protein